MLKDIDDTLANILLGKSKNEDGNFSLNAPLMIEEMEMKWTKRKENIEAEIIAYIGDNQWISEASHTINVRYTLNASRQWEMRGLNVNDPVIQVIPR